MFLRLSYLTLPIKKLVITVINARVVVMWKLQISFTYYDVHKTVLVNIHLLMKIVFFVIVIIIWSMYWSY